MSRDRELSSRRSTFRGGRGLRLADGEVWNLPHPAAMPAGVGGEATHRDLARAICEAENEHERGLAELAFAIFLLNLNYDLSHEDLQGLLSFEPGSDALRDWRVGLRAVVDSHVEHLQGTPLVVPASTFRHAGETVSSRLCRRWFSWFRAPSPVRR